MLRRIINFFKRLFQRLLGRPEPSPATTPQPSMLRTDTEYEALFLQLLEQVYQGASRGQVKGWLMGHKINETEFLAWLVRFGDRLQENPAQHEELAQRMVMLASLDVGELGNRSGRIGNNILAQITPPVTETEPINPIIEAEFVGNGLAESTVSREETPATVETEPEPEVVVESQQNIEVKPIIEADFTGSGLTASSVVATENQELVGEERPTPTEVTVSEQEIDAWFSQGVEQYENDDLEPALISFEKVLQHRPNQAVAWYYRGNILKFLGRLDEALESFNQAVYHQPDYAEAWNDGGSTLERLGRGDDALYCYEKAIELQPNEAYIWKNRGNILLDLGQFQEALASYDKAIELHPDYLKAWYNRGLVLLELERLEEALFSFNKGIEIQEDDADSWYNRGVALERLGQMKEAVEAFQKAQELQPEED